MESSAVNQEELLEQAQELGVVVVTHLEGTTTHWVRQEDNYGRDWWTMEDSEEGLRVSDIYTLAYLVASGGGVLSLPDDGEE